LEVGYGYGITCGSYEEIRSYDEINKTIEIVQIQLGNPHLWSAGLEFRRYVSEKVTFTIGGKFRYLKDIPCDATTGINLSHTRYSIKIGMDFSHKKLTE
jgi:hypothetical protein